AYAERTNQSPGDLITKLGIPPSILAHLDRLGIRLQQIDQLVAGTTIDNDDFKFRLTIILVLRNSVEDENLFLTRLKAERMVKGGKDRYKVDFGSLPLQLARATDKIWVFGWSDDDLKPVDQGPAARLSVGLRETLTDKLPGDASVWIATD